MPDNRQFAPAAARNREPISAVLQHVLPARGLVLEVASGSGEHVVHFAAEFPDLQFQPSDPSPQARASIAAWAAAAELQNIRPPLHLDAGACAPEGDGIWPISAADAVICINMVHISPWAATLGLFTGAAKLLPDGAPLFLYGPYQRGGRHTAPSNAAFDADLKARNPAWGVRDRDDVVAVAAQAGFSAPEIFEMPANNLSLVFRRLKKD